MKPLRRLVCRIRRSHRWTWEAISIEASTPNGASKASGAAMPVCKCGAIDVERIEFAESETRVPLMVVPRARRRPPKSKH